MDEQVDLVANKTGISKSQAKKAVDAVTDFVDDGLPAPLDSQVEKALEGGQTADIVDEVTSGLPGTSGNKV